MSQAFKPVALCQKLLFAGAIATLSLNPIISPAFSEEPSLKDSPKAVVDEVWQVVNTEFVDRNFNNVNWQAKRQELLNKNYSNRKQAYKAIREALKDLGDPYTRFLDPEEFSDLTSQTSGETSGVGVRLTLDTRTSDLVVVEALKESPAFKAGLKTGDRIVRINGKPTALMSLEQASQEIQGEVGTEVEMQISRPGKGVFGVTLTRANIEIPTVTYSLKEEGKTKIGYIKLDEFSSHAAEQMKQAIETLNKQKVSGFVLDLRGNPGGLLFASVDIARLWMKEGKIVSTIDRRGGDRQFSANGTAITDLPLVVLVNQGSASASEILTGALKENKRATVVGTPTYGKATVQSVHDLSDGSGLAVTIARYYPPSGANISKKGIKPDIVQDLTMEQQVKLRDDPSLMGTASDPQYRRAVGVLQSSNFAKPQFNPSVNPIGIRPE